MKIIFGTTNKRKIDDFKNLINILKLDIEVLSLNDINFKEEIEENGLTIDDNSLIKAKTIYEFCLKKSLNYAIITDDSGLFVEVLNGEPGIYTGRYALDEIQKNPNLPKYQSVIKLLKKMENEENRKAFYKTCVTFVDKNGNYFQEFGETNGLIAKEIIGPLEKPYFYSIFIEEKSGKVFTELTKDELENTYRFKALKKVLTKIK